MRSTPLVAQRGQADALFLEEDGGNSWVLKKFKDGRSPEETYLKTISSLLPRHQGFRSGSDRVLLHGTDLLKSKNSYSTVDLQNWLEGTILMPKARGSPWGTIADEIRSGKTTPSSEGRMLLCRKLSEAVYLLEKAKCAHRDLSSGNVFTFDDGVELIDFDSLYHPTLRLFRACTTGTEGYIAPFAYSNGSFDLHKTWVQHVDRYALALLNVEFLSLEKGSALTGDGGMFSQDDLRLRRGRTIDAALAGLGRYPAAAHMLETTIRSTSFEDCPSPEDWLRLADVPVGEAFAISGQELESIPSDYFQAILQRRKVAVATPAPCLRDLPEDRPIVPRRNCTVVSLPKNPWTPCIAGTALAIGIASNPMGLFTHFIAGLAHFAFVVVDVLLILLLLRLLVIWKPNGLLAAVDKGVSPLLNVVLEKITHFLNLEHTIVRDRSRLLIVLALICTLRLVLGIFIQFVLYQNH